MADLPKITVCCMKSQRPITASMRKARDQKREELSRRCPSICRVGRHDRIRVRKERSSPAQRFHCTSLSLTRIMPLERVAFPASPFEWRTTGKMIAFQGRGTDLRVPKHVQLIPRKVCRRPGSDGEQCSWLDRKGKCLRDSNLSDKRPARPRVAAAAASCTRRGSHTVR